MRADFKKISMGTGLVAVIVAGLIGIFNAELPSQANSGLGTDKKCAAFTGLPHGWPDGALAGMVRIEGGEFSPGTMHGYPEERLAGTVTVASFWIDRTEVTNAQFAAFIESTGYITEVEREGGAAVFVAPSKTTPLSGSPSWWRYVEGANWRHPEGADSNLQGRENQPVVQITYSDAQAYAQWLGRQLPTEAQWEYAARANGEAEKLERTPRDERGKPEANFWQGAFPVMNTAEDGFVARSPVGCYAANSFGLHDMIGNVWEWTRDHYQGIRQPHGHAELPHVEREPSGAIQRVIKGGSFLCAANYCQRYRSTARHPQEADLGAAHVGFRTVRVDLSSTPQQAGLTQRAQRP